MTGHISRTGRVAGDRAIRPTYVVWEVTLQCNLKCMHCGSRAGLKRHGELNSDEAFKLIDEFAAIGVEEITLIGGEAYLRPDWLSLVRRITSHKIRCTLQTGARAFTAEKIAAAAEAGLYGFGVSIDGVHELHDKQRGVSGSFRQAIRAIELGRAHGLITTANTQINAMNVESLRQVFHSIHEAGAVAWQVQLTTPMGNASDDPKLILQPYSVVAVIDELYEMFVEGKKLGIRVIPGNNIGYYGPFEAEWRSVTGEVQAYMGCQAGSRLLGVEADGSVKGCPSLPTKDYTAGNVRESSLSEIWRESEGLAKLRNKSSKRTDLWGFCKTCYFSNVCLSGCTWMTHTLFGRPGNNPFCYHRASVLERRGIRETVSPKQTPRSKPAPFDYGQWDIIATDKAGKQYTQTEIENLNIDRPKPADGLCEDVDYCKTCKNLFLSSEELCPVCQANTAVGARNSALFSDTVIEPATAVCPHPPPVR